MIAPSSTYDAGFGIYVHWPFCLSKCPYCDFNSHVRHNPIDEERYVAAFIMELRHRAALSKGRTVHSVFFGGGTPSLMKPSTVGAILNAIAANWRMDPRAEITLEANPTSVEAERFRGYRAVGVNRVSLGVQALRDGDLKALGRLHSVDEAMSAVNIATSVFERTSFDLIYARPQQSVEQWREELRIALARNPTHLSLYQLTIEPDTIFQKLYDAGRLTIPDPDQARALWDVTQETMEQAGLPAYEISNHARIGHESRHNLIYWRYGDYAGVGPGAHGRLRTARGCLAQSTERHPEMWLTVVETDGHGIMEEQLLSQSEQGDEFLLMGLRLKEGIDPSRFHTITGRPLDPERIGDLISHGMIEWTQQGRLRVTQEGFPVLDSVVADLAA